MDDLPIERDCLHAHRFAPEAESLGGCKRVADNRVAHRVHNGWANIVSKVEQIHRQVVGASELPQTLVDGVRNDLVEGYEFGTTQVLVS